MHRLVSVITLAILAAAAAQPGPVLSAGISIRVCPASIVAEVKEGDVLGPITVTNTGASTVVIDGCMRWGGHDENGVPVLRAFEGSPAAQVVLTLEPAAFRLPAGTSRAVRARVHVPPGVSGGAYPAIVFRGRSPVAGDGRPEVGASVQVAVLTLLTIVPGRPGERPEPRPALLSVDIAQESPGCAVRVSATCENEGKVHASLSGTVSVRRQDGSVAAEGVMSPGVCLPGCRRTLAASIPSTRIGRGAYVAEVCVRALGREPETGLIAFRMADGERVGAAHLDLRPADQGAPGGGNPAAPKVVGISIPAVSSGVHLPVEVRLENPTSLELDPLGYMEIWDHLMRRVGLVALGGTALAPGDHALIRLTWPEPLAPGYYTVKATLQGGSELRSASTAFIVGSHDAEREG